MSNMIQILAGIAVVFLLPGYTLVNMLFPRKGELDPEYDIVYRITLGMGMSVVIAIIVGFALNAISTEEHAYVSAGPLWIALLAIVAAFFAVGWYRGAYPSMGLLHPILYRSPARRGDLLGKPLGFAKHRQAERLVLERERLLEDMKKYMDRSATSNPQRKLYYRRRIDQVRDRLDKVNEELAKIGKESV
jgi:hypothetical protein